MFKQTEFKEKNWVPFCPECHHPMVKRHSRFGYFWGCCMYPDCKHIIAIDPLPIFEHDYEYNPHGWSDSDWHEYAEFNGIDESICWGDD